MSQRGSLFSDHNKPTPLSLFCHSFWREREKKKKQERKKKMLERSQAGEISWELNESFITLEMFMTLTLTSLSVQLLGNSARPRGHRLGQSPGEGRREPELWGLPNSSQPRGTWGTCRPPSDVSSMLCARNQKSSLFFLHFNLFSIESLTCKEPFVGQKKYY